MIKIATITIVTVLVMSGCTSNAPKPSVNKTNYSNHTCKQLDKAYDRNNDAILQLTMEKNQEVNTGFNKIMWGNLAPMVAGGEYEKAIDTLKAEQKVIRQNEQKKRC